MVKMIIDFNEEQDEKIRHFQTIFSLKYKPDAVKKIIDLTKITPLNKEKEKDSIMKAFGGKA